MRDVFICDAVRTPIGRFGGSLAKVRADDLAAAPIKALMAKHPNLDWAQVDEVFFGCANQAGEDNRNVARMALLLAGLPDSVPGADPEPALRLRPRRGRRGRPRHPCRRDRACDRRRRRIHDPRALRDGQGAGSLLALRRDLRHHHRLAFHQSADEGAVWRRRHAGDRRERRRGIPGLARRPGRLRDPLAAARGRGDRGGLFRRGDHADHHARRQGRPDHGRQGRASAPRDDAGRPGKTEADRAQSRHRDRRQRLRRQ